MSMLGFYEFDTAIDRNLLTVRIKPLLRTSASDKVVDANDTQLVAEQTKLAKLALFDRIYGDMHRTLIDSELTSDAKVQRVTSKLWSLYSDLKDSVGANP